MNKVNRNLIGLIISMIFISCSNNEAHQQLAKEHAAFEAEHGFKNAHIRWKKSMSK